MRKRFIHAIAIVTLACLLFASCDVSLQNRHERPSVNQGGFVVEILDDLGCSVDVKLITVSERYGDVSLLLDYGKVPDSTPLTVFVNGEPLEEEGGVKTQLVDTPNGELFTISGLPKGEHVINLVFGAGTESAGYGVLTVRVEIPFEQFEIALEGAL